MQKNTVVWLMASYLVVTCLLNDAYAGSEPAQSPWLVEAGQLTHRSVSPSAPLSENSRQLINAIRNAQVHGLNPERYGLSQIMIASDALSDVAAPLPSSENLPATASLLDMAHLRTVFSTRMDQAFVQLASHLGEGVVDARATQRDLYRDAPTVNTGHLLESVRSARQTATQALESVTPLHAEYQRLTHRMRNLLTERAAGIERPVIGDNDTLSVAMSHADVMDIKHRLIESGELPPGTVTTPYFDTVLASALRQFQRRHGLEPDGTVGRQTREALNLSIDDEIRAVALSLERWRWMPRQLGDKHLYINIPDYRVVFRDGADTRLSMVAVVGAVDHQTPTFSRDMSYMEFNPTWTVPQSIANAELIPKEREQPGYLRSRQFDYLKRVGNRLVRVPPDTVSAADFLSKPFPYTLQQRGGGLNDLGRIKFMMPNPYAIYLHDTPSKHHFSLAERAFSHGCIRLSDPDAMASLLMREDGNSPERIRKALQASNTHRIALRTHIPTHLTYMTTWIDDAGTLQRRGDIYQHDSALMSALQASDTLLATLNQPTASLTDQPRSVSSSL